MAVSTPATGAAIFISYRREDGAYPAGWLFDRLIDHFGRDVVFKDLDSIGFGDDFIAVITEALELHCVRKQKPSGELPCTESSTTTSM